LTSIGTSGMAVAPFSTSEGALQFSAMPLNCSITATLPRTEVFSSCPAAERARRLGTQDMLRPELRVAPRLDKDHLQNRDLKLA